MTKTQLWWVRPEAVVASEERLALLNEEERAQQQRFIPPKKRHEYLVTRLLVRTVLGATLGMRPQDITFTHNQWGRPEVSGLHFNLTHTDGLVMCLVSADYEVGVDTELFSRAPRIIGLAPRVFAPREQRELFALPEEQHEERAVTLWTLKESYIKARGMGLALALDGFGFCFDEPHIRVEVEAALNDDGRRWQFETHRLGPHVVSTALAHPSSERIEIEWKQILEL